MSPATAAHAKFFLMSFGNRYPNGAYSASITRLLQIYWEMQFKGKRGEGEFYRDVTTTYMIVNFVVL
jgi:hypothetical protein